MTANKIVPCIWMSAEEGKLLPIIDYYQKVFGEHFHAGNSMSLGTTPSGYTEICEVKIFNQHYSIMNTANIHQPLNDAISLMIKCDDQNEIDHYWNYFTLEGKSSQCGWCIDKFGLRWQIVPKNLGELMRKPNAFEVMMKQTKIIIEEYFK